MKLRCKIGLHRWLDYAKLDERDKTNKLISSTISQVCKDCKKTRAHTVYYVENYHYYYPWEFRYP